MQELVTTIPDTIDAAQRARLLAHVQASDGCRARIERIRGELALALEGGNGAGTRALDLACELDGLERVQLLLDSLLTGLVEVLTQGLRSVPSDDGVPALTSTPTCRAVPSGGTDIGHGA